MLTQGTELPIQARVFELMYDQAVLNEAHELSIHAAKEGRSPEEVEQNSIPSLAVQHAVLEYLRDSGATYAPPPAGTYQYDGVLNGVLVDVKARFDGKYWQQTKWEAWKLNQTGERVLYLCVDVTSDSRFIFRGCIWVENLEPSGYGNPYVNVHNLRDLVLE